MFEPFINPFFLVNKDEESCILDLLYKFHRGEITHWTLKMFLIGLESTLEKRAEEERV